MTKCETCINDAICNIDSIKHIIEIKFNDVGQVTDCSSYKHKWTMPEWMESIWKSAFINEEVTKTLIEYSMNLSDSEMKIIFNADFVEFSLIVACNNKINAMVLLHDANLLVTEGKVLVDKKIIDENLTLLDMAMRAAQDLQNAENWKYCNAKKEVFNEMKEGKFSGGQ